MLADGTDADRRLNMAICPSMLNRWESRMAVSRRSGNPEVDWGVFLQKGVIVDIQIRRYRGMTTLDFAELGINEEASEVFKQFLAKYIRPGQKRLIPSAIEGHLRSIESQARQNLKEHSFPCDALGEGGKFVPVSAYRDFKEENERLCAEFYQVRNEFAENYDAIIERVRRDYKVLAENLYRQSHPDAKRMNRKFVNQFVDSIVSQIPPKEDIVETFTYTTILRRISPYLLSVMKRQPNIDAQAMRIEAAGHSSSPQQALLPQVSDAEHTRRRTHDKVNQMTSYQFVEDDTEELITNDIDESLRTRADVMRSQFIDDVMVRLRTTAYEGARAIVDSIDRNDGKFIGRTSMKATSTVATLRKMDFYGDPELQSLVDALDESITITDDRERDVPSIRAAAQAMYEWARSSLGQIDHDMMSEVVMRADRANEKHRVNTQKKQEERARQREDTKKEMTITVPKNRRRRTIKRRAEA